VFDIGFGELLLVFVIGLIVLGPQRLPVAVRTVAGWVRALRSLATTVQNELTQELKLQEFQESLKKVEKASIDNLTPELKATALPAVPWGVQHTSADLLVTDALSTTVLT